MRARVGAEAERPEYLEVAGEQLLLLRTDPPPGLPRRDVGVILLQSGDLRNVSFQRNRIAIRQARRLAALGFPVLRFDYAGIGDSTGSLAGFDINDPPAEQVVAVAAHARRTGMGPVALCAVCMGGRTALAAAAESEDVVGVLVGAMPIAVRSVERRAAEWRMLRYVAGARRGRLARLRDRERRREFLLLVARRARAWLRALLPRRRQPVPDWVSRPTVEAVEQLLDRGVPVCFAYGQQDALLRDFTAAREGRFGAVLRRHDELVDVDTSHPGVLHGFPTLASQSYFEGLVEEWVDRRFASGSRTEEVAS